jgi:glyoxylase-like metal-dependent hydrolase (beta-lactamase superfamily II)
MTWHTTTRIAENLYRISEPFGAIEPRFGAATVNMYLVIGQERAALIDSGCGIGDVRAEVRRITSLPCTVLNTHYHWDHAGANSLFEERAIHESEVDLLAQEQDLSWLRPALRSPAARAVLPAGFDPAAYRILAKPATRVLHDNDVIDLGGRMLLVLHIPGHSPGHVAYLDATSHVLFTGDTAQLGPMYACFEGSDPKAFAHSVKRLAALEGVRTICPGHNEVITEQDWLRELAEGFEAAVAGKIVGQMRDEFVVGREFRFGASSVWLPRRKP